MNYTPIELMQTDHWLLANKNKVPHTLTRDGRWVAASVTNPVLRVGYETVVAACDRFNRSSTSVADRCLPGFVLSDDTAYAVIDIDVKDGSNCDDSSKWSSEEFLRDAHSIIDEMGSYTEYSRSGVGYHIWVKVPAAMKDRALWPNVKKSGVEVYFRDRFILCTGEAVEGYDIPIVDASDKVADLLRRITPEKFAPRQKDVVAALEEGEPELSDEEVLDELESCENAELYMSLMDGDWKNKWNGKEYGSQSEADAALIEGIYFFSRNRGQTRRIFMRSKLADRLKAQRGNYVVNTVDSMADKVDGEDMSNTEVASGIVHAVPVPSKGTVAPVSIDDPAKIDVCGHIIDLSSKLTEADLVSAVITAANGSANLVDTINMAALAWRDFKSKNSEKYASVDFSKIESIHGLSDDEYDKVFKIGTGEVVDLPHPPGALGEISRWIERDSYKPTKEGAIAAAIAYASGIAGKAWKIGGRTGLNNYVVLLGKSAVGKSTSINSVGAFHRAVTSVAPQADKMFGKVAPGSDIGFLRVLEEIDSLTIRYNEFGKMMAIASSGKPSPQKSVMDELLRLYDASEAGSVINSVVYSKKENNITISGEVGVSIIGDGVSSDYYKSLSGAMASDGLLSRLLVIEYTGRRQYSNRSKRVPPPVHLVNKVADIASDAIHNNAAGNYINITFSANASMLLEKIEDMTDDDINDRIPDKRAFVATRKAIKISKLAGLLAVFDNHNEPEVKLEHVKWAAEVVNQCMARELWWIEQGVVAGASDNIDVENLYIRRIVDFLKEPYGDGVTMQMAKDGVVQLSSLKLLARDVGAIEAYKSGNGAKGYKAVIDELKASGRLIPFSRRKAKALYNSGADCYTLSIGVNNL